MTDGYLDKVYAARDTAATRDIYNAWSQSYDDEVKKHGYVTPKRCAEALAQFASDASLPVLDFGCGTGLSGLALKLEGFGTIDGIDLSEDMIAEAKSKNVYRKLSIVNPDEEAADLLSGYTMIAAIGVIGAGAAPASAFDDLMAAMDSGGLLVLSLNDHTLKDPQYEARLHEWTDCGAARILFAEHGDHLPGIDLKSTVYVVEKI